MASGAYKNLRLVTLMCAACVGSSGCDGHDSDYFPYTMKGLNVHVHDNNSRKDYFAGFVEASYLSRQKALSECASRASSTANFNKLRDWSYVCCTVTSSSSCVTKVR